MPIKTSLPPLPTKRLGRDEGHRKQKEEESELIRRARNLYSGDEFVKDVRAKRTCEGARCEIYYTPEDQYRGKFKRWTQGPCVRKRSSLHQKEHYELKKSITGLTQQSVQVSSKRKRDSNTLVGDELPLRNRVMVENVGQLASFKRARIDDTLIRDDARAQKRAKGSDSNDSGTFDLQFAADLDLPTKGRASSLSEQACSVSHQGSTVNDRKRALNFLVDADENTAKRPKMQTLTSLSSHPTNQQSIQDPQMRHFIKPKPRYTGWATRVAPRRMRTRSMRPEPIALDKRRGYVTVWREDYCRYITVPYQEYEKCYVSPSSRLLHCTS